MPVSGLARMQVDDSLFAPPKAPPPPMNIGLVVNARGKVCLVHDEPFETPPLWVVYDLESRNLRIIFDNGSDYPIDWQAPDDVHNYLVKIKKILIVRMEDKKPVEGYDTNFVKSRNGKFVEG